MSGAFEEWHHQHSTYHWEECREAWNAACEWYTKRVADAVAQALRQTLRGYRDDAIQQTLALFNKHLAESGATEPPRSHDSAA